MERAGRDRGGEGRQKMAGAIEPGAIERNGAEEEEGPDGEFAISGTIREPGSGHHSDDGEKVGDGGEPADADDIYAGGVEEDGRQPEDKAIHPKTPQRIDQAEHPYGG